MAKLTRSMRSAHGPVKIGQDPRRCSRARKLLSIREPTENVLAKYD